MIRINQAAIDEGWGALHQVLGPDCQIPILADLERTLAKRATVRTEGEFTVTNALAVPEDGGALTVFDGGFVRREETPIGMSGKVSIRVQYGPFATGLLLESRRLRALPVLYLKAKAEKDEAARILGVRPLDLPGRLGVLGRSKRDAARVLVGPVRRLIAGLGEVTAEIGRGYVLLRCGRSLAPASVNRLLETGRRLAELLEAALKGEIVDKPAPKRKKKARKKKKKAKKARKARKTRKAKKARKVKKARKAKKAGKGRKKRGRPAKSGRKPAPKKRKARQAKRKRKQKRKARRQK